jgi:predicted O-linked N-acetylglucosamine transferase (SPINDLY family)
MTTPPLLLVAATLLEEGAFRRESLLGRSLALPAHASYGRCLGYANRRALAHTYNRGLEQADEEALVVFCHDDLWLGEQSLVAPLTQALERFDLVGVAGNSRRLHGQQAWWLNADGSGWDHPQLVGALRHGRPEAAQLQTYGPSPAPAALLDGVFLAGRAGVLRRAGLRFDPDLPFHLYDLDLCRSAEQAGLRLGVWPLDLIHASGGDAFTPSWKACLVLYRRKWEPPTPAPAGPELLRWQYVQARAHQLLDQWPEALAAYDALLALEPHHGRALQQRALVLHQLDRPSEALASLDAALALDPANATALANRASLLQLLEDPAGAEAALRAALAQRPDDPDLLYRLATLLGRQHRPIEAIAVLRQLLRLDRHHTQALLDLGGLLLEAGGFALARSAFQRVLSQQPSHGQALFGLGQCHEASGDADAALATYTQGLEQAPDDLNLLTMAESMRLGHCLWDDYPGRMERLAERLEQGLVGADPVPMGVPMRLLSFPLPLALPALVAARHAEAIAAAMAPLAPAQAASPRAPKGQTKGRPLRIGYLSADFRCHAMGGLIHGLFAQHDRRRCVPIGYMLAASRDRFTRSVARGCERLRDVSQLGSEALAGLIRDDGIDVLVDLMGYTHQGRPSLLALRPAPLQLLYLGYPGSMGAPFIDGLVADAWLIPPELEHGYSEQVHRLPHGFVCSAPLPADPGEALPPPPSRAALGLEPGQLVYACFNRADKFDPQRFAAWMAVLHAVPSSVLLLVVSHPASQRRLRQRAQACGVEAGRLIFAARTPAAQFADLCRLADLFLDTAHYGAGATGAMALQAGLPLLTCPGEAFVSRMGASLCAAVGMDDLICPSAEAYVARAIELGRDPEQLWQRRQRLLDPGANLPLFDTAGWVRHWEDLLHGLLLRQAGNDSDRSEADATVA